MAENFKNIILNFMTITNLKNIALFLALGVTFIACSKNTDFEGDEMEIPEEIIPEEPEPEVPVSEYDYLHLYESRNGKYIFSDYINSDMPHVTTGAYIGCEIISDSILTLELPSKEKITTKIKQIPSASKGSFQYQIISDNIKYDQLYINDRKDHILMNFWTNHTLMEQNCAKRITYNGSNNNHNLLWHHTWHSEDSEFTMVFSGVNLESKVTIEEPDGNSIVYYMGVSYKDDAPNKYSSIFLRKYKDIYNIHKYKLTNIILEYGVFRFTCIDLETNKTTTHRLCRDDI